MITRIKEFTSKNKKTLRKITNSLWCFSAILLTWYLLFGYKYSFIYNHGDSMEPAFFNGDWVIVEKNKGEIPHRFDCIIIEEGKDDLVKRVIGLPLDTIEIIEGNIYLNGKLFNDPYGQGKIFDFLVDENNKHLRYWSGDQIGKKVTRLVNMRKETVPKGHIWVIGDNRGASWYGTLPIKNIKALVIF